MLNYGYVVNLLRNEKAALEEDSHKTSVKISALEDEIRRLQEIQNQCNKRVDEIDVALWQLADEY